MNRSSSSAGFGMVEMLVGLTVTLFVMAGLAGLLMQNARLNKDQRMQAAVQANARTTLHMILQRVRSAGWNPTDAAGIGAVATDPDLGDDVSQLEVFADLDEDGLLNTVDERLLIRHIGNRVEWRRSPSSAFEVLATNITNDADADGNIEPLFVPDSATDPRFITVQITAQSPAPDPATGQFIRYTVSSEVVLREVL